MSPYEEFNADGCRRLFIVISCSLALLVIIILASCAPIKESLTECDPDDRYITGISRNGKKYTTADGCGKKAGKVKPILPPDTSHIGDVLISIAPYDKP